MKARYLKRKLFVFAFVLLAGSVTAQTWTDSLDQYLRTTYTPPNQFVWRWQDAPILHAMEYQYDRMPEAERDAYFTYVKRAIDRNLIWVNGTSPNAVAAGVGLAFLYRITGDLAYFNEARHVFMDYLRIPRTSNNGVSHLVLAPELWDDTIYMIGVFLISMYRATGDEVYIDELIEQFAVHREKLEVEEWGLWVHGWDDDDLDQFDFCSQLGWADDATGRSAEIWGRGNGWLLVTLGELLNTLPEDHPHRAFAENALFKMVEHLPELQDPATGHWYQLPVRPGEQGNYLESSCTAMFGFGLVAALQHGVVTGQEYTQAVHRAYHGLRDFSTFPVQINGSEFLTTRNVAGETCIGDTEYYFNIEATTGQNFALSTFVLFGRAFEYYESGVPTATDDSFTALPVSIYPAVTSANTTLTVQVEGQIGGKVSFEVADMSGRRVILPAASVQHISDSWRISLGNLPPGAYILSLRTDSGQRQHTGRFMIR